MVQRKQQKISKVWSTPYFFLLKENIVKRKNVLSLILLELHKRKNRQMHCEGLAFNYKPGNYIKHQTQIFKNLFHFF